MNEQPMFPAKFCHIVDGEQIPHDYGNLYFEQPCGQSTRLVIGPSTNHVKLMTDLATELEGHPWFVLYVLLVPRRGNHEQGRYQSPPIETHSELSAFLSAFHSFFESDGRHHVWVGSAAQDGMLVYDQHNVIFAYGPIERYKSILVSRGFRDSEFWFPYGHSHSYLPENDSEEDRLLAEYRWRRTSLQPGDEWK
jgi:hypothetical protein